MIELLDKVKEKINQLEEIKIQIEEFNKLEEEIKNLKSEIDLLKDMELRKQVSVEILTTKINIVKIVKKQYCNLYEPIKPTEFDYKEIENIKLIPDNVNFLLVDIKLTKLAIELRENLIETYQAKKQATENKIKEFIDE